MNFRPIEDLNRLCIHTITTRSWSIEEAAEKYSRAGVKGISVWRQYLEGRDIAKTGEMLHNHGLEIVSLVRGGFFSSTDPEKRRSAIDDNKKAIDEAAALGASMVVLVCGADVGQSLVTSRTQIQQGIEKILPYAIENNIKLAIEPLHPMYADTRSAINTLAQANTLAEVFDSVNLGVAVDVYHLWWDPELEQQIRRCGENRNLFAFHICDWMSPTTDLLNDRGLMGAGCIPIKQIRGWVETAGFKGYNEVEIFSDKLWATDQDEFLKRIIENYYNFS